MALATTFWSAYRHRGMGHARRGDHQASVHGNLQTRECAGDQERWGGSPTPAIATQHASEIGNLSGMLRRISAHAGQGAPRRPPLARVRHDRLPQLGRGESGDAFDRPLMVGGLDIVKQCFTF